jgi:hypothetical protein
MIGGIADECGRQITARAARATAMLSTPYPEALGGNLTNQNFLGAQGQAAHPHATKCVRNLSRSALAQWSDLYWHIQHL